MSKWRLSGWARLWIVLLVPVYCLSVWIGVDAEQHRWRSACDWRDCAGFSAPRRWDEAGRAMLTRDEIADAELSDIEQQTGLYRLHYNDEGEPIAGDQYTLDMVQHEIERRATARRVHEERLRSAFVTPTIGVVLFFALMMLAKSAAIWVWRGFRPATVR